MQLHEAILRFLEYCELDKNLSPKTVKMYSYYLHFFETWITKSKTAPAADGEEVVRATVKVEEIDEEDVRQFRLYLSHRYKNPVKGELKRQTQNYFLIALRSLFRFMVKQKLSVLAPEVIELGKTRDRVIKHLEPLQLEELFKSVSTRTERGVRDRTILEVLFSTGLRVSELRSSERGKW